MDKSFPHKSSLLISDPVYGFTRIARGVLTDIVDHPLFQRLGRIRQLGLSSLVYPGAVHTRLQHSIGAYHLMSEALKTLAEKGVFIFDAEVEAAQAAILLHDIGHCAFSHVLERVFLPDVTHENITLQMIERMNKAFKGALTLAIELLSADCKKPFLHELICSQLDVDRLDYLCRDSFFTGVREGNIGAARIIRTLNVFDDHLVVEDKGLYSVENYLMSRRMMYWQVYLHKTVVAAEELLRSTLRRAQT
uniref:HD domain-containing protein n=1 Tax=Alloprevotella tannerae TaxID=76122 RepID=UPI0028F116A0